MPLGYYTFRQFLKQYFLYAINIFSVAGYTYAMANDVIDWQQILPLLKQINDFFDKRGNATARNFGLTLAQFRVLMFLEHHKDTKVTQRLLEKEFGVSHPTINGIIKRLELKKYINCKFIQESKLQKYIFLTEEGQKALNAMKQSRIDDESVLSTKFTKEEKENFKNYLERILFSLK